MKHGKQDTFNLKVNWSAIDHAKHLIQQGKVNCTDSCGQSNPIIKDEEKFLKHNSLEEYGKWFFVINEDVKQSNKNHYELPLGDFNFIFRDSVLAAQKHAEMYHYDEGIIAAQELLILINKKCQLP